MPPKGQNNITDVDFEFIADKIRQSQCVLVLGPEVFQTAEGKSCEAALLDYLSVAENPLIAKYYPEDNFFLFNESFKRTQVIHKVKKFYRDQAPSALLLTLAQLPFHIYLTVTPDLLVREAFDELQFSYQSGAYKKNKEPQIIKAPQKANPLIYNAFGSIESEESMVLTHDDLYDYFKSIFAQQSMPDKLKIPLQEVKNFIFLGISFDKWYMQLLMRELEIHNRNYEFTRYAANQEVSNELKTLCMDQFQIQFVNHGISEFINSLKAEFTEGELRKTQPGSDKGLDSLKKYIADGKVDRCLEEMESIVTDTSLEEVYDLINSRYSRLYRRKMKGVIAYGEYVAQENTIIDDLLGLIKQGKIMGL